MPRPLRPVVASAATLALLLGACGDDDEAPADDPQVENQEEVDAGDGPSGTEVPSGGGAATTGGTGADQGNVEPDSPDDSTVDTAQGG